MFMEFLSFNPISGRWKRTTVLHGGTGIPDDQFQSHLWEGMSRNHTSGVKPSEMDGCFNPISGRKSRTTLTIFSPHKH